MKVSLYSVRDICNGFGSPMVDNNDESAKRNFTYAVNDGGIINFKPSDFDLFKIGEFDSESGAIASVVPVLIARGVEVFNA